MKNINTKLIIGTMVVLGATSCGNDMASKDGNRLTTNISDTMSYTDYVDMNNNGLGNSYTDYAGTNNYMTTDRMEYIKNDYSFDNKTNNYSTTKTNDYANMKGIVDYKGEETRRRLNSNNDTYDNTGYNMVLDNRYSNNVNDMIDNGRVDNYNYNNTVENNTNNVVDDVRELADVTMEQVGDVTDNLVNDTKNMTNTVNNNVTGRTTTTTTTKYNR